MTLYGLLPQLYASTSPRLPASLSSCHYDAIVSLFIQKLLLWGHNVRYKVMKPFIHCHVSLEVNN